MLPTKATPFPRTGRVLLGDETSKILNQLSKGNTYHVRVLGLQRESIDGVIYPVFVCEFADGSIRNIYSEHVRLDPIEAL